MHISKHLKGEIMYNNSEDRSNFKALLDYDGRIKKGMSIEELAQLLIEHEGWNFEIKIYDPKF